MCLRRMRCSRVCFGCGVCTMIATNLVSGLSGIEMRSIASLYESVGFGTADAYMADPSLLARMFDKAGYGVFAVRDDEPERVIGCARILSDNVVTSWLAEICVHPDFQRQGIGSAIMDEVLNKFGHTAIYSEIFEQNVGFFSSLGVVPRKKLVVVSRAAGQVSKDQRQCSSK